MEENFGVRLNGLRTGANLTVQQLADRAEVPPTLISGLQNNNRQIGENNARKLGTALGLAGTELEEFVYLAINNAKERVLEEFKAYPAEVLNLVALELRDFGIRPEHVNRCILKPSLRDGQKPDAAVYLKDGRSALIEISVTAR